MRALAASVGHSHVMVLPLDKIRARPGFNLRPEGPEKDAHVNSFRVAIQAGVYIPPALIQWDGEIGWIIEGHCRFAAYTAEAEAGAEIAGMTCVLAPQTTSDADAVAIMLTSSQGLALPATAQIEGIKRLLVGFHWPKEKIASKLGKSVRQIDALMDLAAAPQELQDMVAAGQIAPTEVNRAVKLNGKEGAVAVIKAGQEIAQARGSRVVRPRDIAATKPREAPLTGDQKAILRFLARYDAMRVKPALPIEVQEALDGMRECVP